MRYVGAELDLLDQPRPSAVGAGLAYPVLGSSLNVHRDSFNRADGAPGTLDYPRSRTWTLSGTWAIASNALVSSTVGSYATAVTETYSPLGRCRVKVRTAGTGEFYVVFNYVAATDHYRVGRDGTGAYVLQKIRDNTTAAGWTGGFVQLNTPPTPADGDVIDVQRSGNDGIDVWINGVHIWSAGDPFLLSKPTWGLATYRVGSAPTVAFESWEFTPYDSLGIVPDGVSTVRYVTADGSDQNDGRTLTTGKATSAAAVSSLGSSPGVVRYGVGTYDATNLTLKSGVAHQAILPNATVWRLPNSSPAGSSVAKTENFDTLSAGNTNGGPTDWRIEGIVIDGNKANNASGGPALAIYGYRFQLRDVEVKNAKGDGIYSQWTDTAGAIIPESRLEGVLVHDCDGDGIDWNGPNDPQFVNVVVALNGARGIHAGPKGTAGQCSNVHVWGLSHTVGIDIEATGWYLGNCEAEGASVRQVFIGANDCAIVGGHYFGAGNNTGAEGIKIGDASHTNVAGYYIATKVTDCQAGEIVFGSDAGGMLLVSIYRAVSGSATSGTISGATYGVVRVSGAGSGDFSTLPALVGNHNVYGALTAIGTAGSQLAARNGTTGIDVFNINASGLLAEFLAEARGYNGNYSDLRWQIFRSGLALFRNVIQTVVNTTQAAGAGTGLDTQAGAVHKVTVTGNMTTGNPLQFPYADGHIVVIELLQDATGGRTMLVPTRADAAAVLWNGPAPVPPTTANAKLSLTLRWDGTNWTEISRAGDTNTVTASHTPWRSDATAAVAGQGLDLPSALTELAAATGATRWTVDGTDISAQVRLFVNMRVIAHTGGNNSIVVSIRDTSNTANVLTTVTVVDSGAGVNVLGTSAWTAKPAWLTGSKTLAVYTSGGDGADDYVFPTVKLDWKP